MESTSKISKSQLLSTIARHYPSTGTTTTKVVNIEDLSSGCDNWIFCVSMVNNNNPNEHDKVIVRYPRKLSDPDCPKMHFPKFQAYILTILEINFIPGPKLLHQGQEYLIESYLEATDLSKVEVIPKIQLKQIYEKMGFYTQKLHSIECCHRFGYIRDIDPIGGTLVGQYDNWVQMFDNEFPDNLKECLSKKLIDQDKFETLNRLFNDVRAYLKSYSVPRLLHSDICGNNTRVVFNEERDWYEFNGFVDFADCMSGDPLFDLGEVLVSYFGDYSVLDMFECGYGQLSLEDRAMIRFYAIHYNIWLLNSSVLSKDTDKWLHTLNKLIV